jgi:hypothetical protein
MSSEMEKDDILLYWRDDLVGRVYGYWWYDYPRWMCGKFEPINTDSEAYSLLVWLSKENEKDNFSTSYFPERFKVNAPFPECYFEGWRFVRSDGMIAHINLPDPEFNGTLMTLVWDGFPRVENPKDG